MNDSTSKPGLHIQFNHCEINLGMTSAADIGKPPSIELAEFQEPQFRDPLAAALQSAVRAGVTAIRVRADGTLALEGEACTDFVAVLFPETGWMVAAATLTDDGKAFPNHQAAEEGARKLDLVGYDDWQLAPLEVWERHVLNRTRHNPAVHIDLFPNMRTDDWYWTGDTCVWSVDEATGVAASAWGVDAGYGLVGGLLRNGSGFALAARRAGQ